VERIPGVTRRADGSVRIRPTGRRRLLDAAVNLLLPLACLPVYGASWFWLALCGGCVAAGDLVARRPGITLRPEGALLHGLFRRRSVPWSDVQAVTVDDYAGLSVLLWTAARERIRLAAPATMRPGARFDAGVDLIGQYWIAHRGPGWMPVWPVPVNRST
jgi:hypothetical protein